jgi:tryptophan-rich sensory protein
MKTMSIAGFSEALSATAVSQFIQTTEGLIPSLQTIHIICIAVLWASALMVDLRVLGKGLRSEPLQAVADRFIPSIWICIVILLATGALLIVAEPGRTLSNPAFYLKMSSLIIAIFVTLWLRNFARGSKPVTGLPVAAAIVSMLLWVTIIVSGRLIAYVT